MKEIYTTSTTVNKSSAFSSDVMAENADIISQQKSKELDELRKRRHAREAREVKRERQMLAPPGQIEQGSCLKDDIKRRYQDQFHPSLSRK